MLKVRQPTGAFIARLRIGIHTCVCKLPLLLPLWLFGSRLAPGHKSALLTWLRPFNTTSGQTHPRHHTVSMAHLRKAALLLSFLAGLVTTAQDVASKHVACPHAGSTYLVVSSCCNFGSTSIRNYFCWSLLLAGRYAQQGQDLSRLAHARQVHAGEERVWRPHPPSLCLPSLPRVAVPHALPLRAHRLPRGPSSRAAWPTSWAGPSQSEGKSESPGESPAASTGCT